MVRFWYTLDIIIWAIRFRAGVGKPVKETVQQTVDKHIYNFCSKSSYIFKKKSVQNQFCASEVVNCCKMNT